MINYIPKLSVWL